MTSPEGKEKPEWRFCLENQTGFFEHSTIPYLRLSDKAMTALILSESFPPRLLAQRPLDSDQEINQS